MIKVSSSVLFCILLSFSATAESKSWPQWRGPDASGHTYDGEFPKKWGLSSNLVWKAPLPGRGHSSAVHHKGKVWITTAIETPASEKEKEERLKANEGLASVTVLSEVSLRALRIDPKNGKILKNIEVIQKEQPQWVHHLNSYASPTPVIEDDRLYLHFGAYGNACIDSDSGKTIWTNSQKELWVMHENGPGSSPMIWENLMIFHLDGSDKQSIVALFKDTGKIAWQTYRSGDLRENPQLQKSYSTPIIANFNGQPILISCSADWVYGYNPRDGEERWWFDHQRVIDCCGGTQPRRVGVRRGEVGAEHVDHRFGARVRPDGACQRHHARSLPHRYRNGMGYGRVQRTRGA